MKFLIKGWMIGVMLAFSHATKAQVIRAFTPDSIKYFEEISKMFLDADKKRFKPFVEAFETVWYSGKVKESVRDNIYKTSNTMLKKRMRNPEFQPYLFSIMSFIASDQSEENFVAWQKSINRLLEERNKRWFVDYVKMSANLFSDNIIFKSTSTIWKSDNSNYKFVYDSVPKVIFPSLNLACYAKKDSSVIYNTKGVYYPKTNSWEGEGGKITWERVGLDPTETYAVFEKYKLRIKSSGFTIDSVIFFNAFFQQPLRGRLSEKILAKTGEDATYPRFESYDKRLFISNIIEGVDYDGGFTMHGVKLLGSGSKEEPAQMIFYRNDKPFLVTRSLFYTIKPRRIASARVEATFYLDEDSINHPGLVMKFIKEDRLLTLVRDVEVSKSPYFNSFHNIDMYFEALYWKIDDPIIEMGALFGSTDKKARFESISYYEQERYDFLQGMDQLHPLVRLKDISEQLNSRAFRALDVAKEMRITMPQIIPLLMNLASMGFIAFDVKTEAVTVKDKCFEYVLARAGKIDYDIIRLESEVSSKSNAVLNLLNYDLQLRGITRINLSDSQRVAAFPSNQQITMKRNRDFSYMGALVAGRTTYFGKEFVFEYDAFKMNLVNVDSMQMRAISFDENDLTHEGKKRTVKVRSVVEGIRGVISIDNPFNKSGVNAKEHPRYPILVTTKKSYVFYDNNSKQGGLYDRDRFYFQIEPFEIDSLDNYTNQSIDFKGNFVSAGIFPDFKEALTIMPDYSLGFVRATPREGFYIYGGKDAKFNNNLTLDYQGLTGDGSIDFLHSRSESDAFTFLLDSVSGNGSFLNRSTPGNVEFPAVTSKMVRIKYIPEKKALIAKKVYEDFDFFDGQAKLDGVLVLKPKGMVGRGSMGIKRADLESDFFKFGQHTIDADTANLSLFGLNLQGLESDNVYAHVDFIERKGEFKSNDSNSPTRFPEVEYICFMDKIDWYMDREQIELSAEGQKSVDLETDLDLTSSNFYSTHKDQDSLNFSTPKANYDLKNSIMTCKGVPYIQVADARVIPDSGQVIIHKKAKMQTLNNAGLTANSITKYHHIYNASINIFSRKNYSGVGDYDYKDENDETQKIHFTNINVDTTFQTVATGKILPGDQFSLSSNFAYKGDVKLVALQKHLLFTGSTKIFHDCDGIAKNWMNFSASIDPKEVLIPVNAEMSDLAGNPIGAGLVLNPDSISVYSTFLSIKKSDTHIDVLSADGFLRFDKKSQAYQISNKDKLKERSLPGNFISLSIKGAACEVEGDGRFNFGTKLGMMKVEPLGRLKHNLNDDEIHLRSSTAIDFPFNEQALSRMTTLIVERFDLDPVRISGSTYKQALNEEVGLEKADKIYGDLSLNGKMKKIPSEMLHTLYLADVKFKWNPENTAFESVGKIGLGHVGKKQVFKYVTGKIQIKKQRVSVGDAMTIYLELDANNWFFFTYSRGMMQSLSSDKEFNTFIKETKPDKRKFKGEKEEGTFSYMLSTARKRTRFLQDVGNL